MWKWVLASELEGNTDNMIWNISVLLKVVWISVIFLVLRFSIDHASTYCQLKIKESFHIEQLKPELNKQVEHVNLSLHF